MTHYPSPWPAAFATMFAALLVGGGTVFGVFITLRSNRSEREKDRAQDAFNMDRELRVTAFAEYLNQGSNIYIWARIVVDNVNAEPTRQRKLPGIDIPLFSNLDKRVNLLTRSQSTYDLITRYNEAAVAIMESASLVSETNAQSGDLTEPLSVFKQTSSEFNSLSSTLAHQFRSELHSDK